MDGRAGSRSSPLAVALARDKGRDGSAAGVQPPAGTTTHAVARHL
jgi:hypothetical protein